MNIWSVREQQSQSARCIKSASSTAVSVATAIISTMLKHMRGTRPQSTSATRPLQTPAAFHANICWRTPGTVQEPLFPGGGVGSRLGKPDPAYLPPAASRWETWSSSVMWGSCCLEVRAHRSPSRCVNDPSSDHPVHLLLACWVERFPHQPSPAATVATAAARTIDTVLETPIKAVICSATPTKDVSAEWRRSGGSWDVEPREEVSEEPSAHPLITAGPFFFK